MAAVVAVAIGTGSAFAANKTWTGGATPVQGGAAWGSNQNWTPPGTFSAADDAFFTSTFTNGTAITLGTGQTANSVTIGTGTSFSLGGTGPLVLSSGSLTRTAASSGTQSLTSGVTLAANAAWAINGSGAMVVDGAITGGFSITKSGTGLLSLTGNNTFTGGLAVNGGTVRGSTSSGALGNNTLTLGGGNVELANDTGLNFGRNTTVTSSGTIFSERLTAGAGVTHTLGTLSIGAQTLAVATDASVTSGTAGVAFSGAVTLTGNPTFDTAAATELHFNSTLSGAFSLTKTGAGTLTLKGASSLANTTVSGGRLNVNVAQALGTLTGTLSLAANTTLGNTSGGDVTVINAKSISLGSSLAFAGPSNLNVGEGTATLSATNTTIDVSAGTLTFGGNVVGSGLGITKTGTGVLVFNQLGAGAYTGNTTISQGELSLTGLSVLGGGTGTIVTIENGAYLRIGSSASIGQVTLQTWPGGLITTVTTTANVSFTTSGTLTSSASFFDGTQTVNAGVIVSSSANNFGTIPQSFVADRIVVQNSGTLQALSSFDIEPTQGVLLPSGTATISVTGGGTQRIFLESVVSGSGTLRKNGVGNVRLLGNNTYSGGTVIEQGIIGITSDASLGAVTGGVQIAGGELVAAQTATGSATDVTVATARPITIGNGTTSALSAQTGNRLAYSGTITEITGGSAGNLRVGLAGAREGTVVLGGSNTYRGSTTIAAGVLEVASLADGGSPSGIGQSSNAAANLVFAGGGLLRFGGATGSTDRLFTVGAGGGGIDSGTGTVAFTNGGNASLIDSGSREFILRGSGRGQLATVLADADASNKTSLTKTGGGVWELTSAQQFTGTAAVNEGTLLVNGSLASPVNVAAGATLGGSGTIGGFTSISGVHAPGNSPGLETFNSGLTYGSTAVLQWELSANTNSAGDRGTLYDGVNVTGGNLQIDAGAVIDLIFNSPLSTGTASSVLWADSFWDVNRQWTVIDYSGGGSSTGAFTVRSVGNDSGGNSLTSVRQWAYFDSERVGDDIVVAYYAPEPGSFVIAGLGLGLIGWRFRRRLVPRRAAQANLAVSIWSFFA